jgi:hypothetical protein
MFSGNNDIIAIKITVTAAYCNEKAVSVLEHNDVETYGGAVVKLNTFITLISDAGEW